ncbi:troponin I [Bombyx mori]|uniref:Troponin I n=1 Tax=Bombyx mori TaxID=7091 RepID=Q5FYZ4_BOMMO|nr:troponin I [Bombyx mori]AAW66633.1 troponin I [Bombyx mori]
MADDEKKRLEEAKKAKQAEIDRKRAEVRKRMEEASKAKKAKKGFMTPERKKKLRLLLRKKAAEELKKEQERKAAERGARGNVKGWLKGRRIIEERCGKPKDIDDANEDTIKRVCKDYHERIARLEDEKFDLEYIVKRKDMEISDLNSQVNDLRGKFVKPTLKKVSKYENKFAKLQKKAAEFNFRNQLKVVKKKEFTLEEEDKEKKPDWSKGKPGDQKVKEEEVEA